MLAVLVLCAEAVWDIQLKTFGRRRDVNRLCKFQWRFGKCWSIHICTRADWLRQAQCVPKKHQLLLRSKLGGLLASSASTHLTELTTSWHNIGTNCLCATNSSICFVLISFSSSSVQSRQRPARQTPGVILRKLFIDLLQVRSQ